jgi:hypothetical protein
MAAWTSDELTKIAAADELEIASARRDGTLRNPVTIWVVRHGDDLYVRSIKGRNGGWFPGTQSRYEGRMWAGGVERDIAIQEANHAMDDEIDAEYRSKYGGYPATYVNSVLSSDARASTLMLLPR